MSVARIESKAPVIEGAGGEGAVMNEGLHRLKSSDGSKGTRRMLGSERVLKWRSLSNLAVEDHRWHSGLQR